jgi:hypothetical protein
MARVSEAIVKQLMETALTEEQIAPFLTDANAFVTAKLGGSGLSALLLARIEANMAAHYITDSRDPEILEEKIGPATTKFGSKKGEGLRSTGYGRTAISLDTTGTLADVGKKGARIDVIELDQGVND